MDSVGMHPRIFYDNGGQTMQILQKLIIINHDVNNARQAKRILHTGDEITRDEAVAA